MAGTDLCVNKPHFAAAVRPWESEATTSALPPARVRTCSVLSGSCWSDEQLWLQKKSVPVIFEPPCIYQLTRLYIPWDRTVKLDDDVSRDSKEINTIVSNVCKLLHTPLDVGDNHSEATT